MKVKKRVYKKFTKKVKQRPPLEVVGVLTREEQLRVIQWLVELKSTGDIQELIEDEFHKNISRMAIWKYSQAKKWKPLIARLRRRFENSLTKIPIANKIDRMRILQCVVKEGMKWSLKGYSKDGDPIYELKIGDVVRACREAREEVKEKKITVDGTINLNLTQEERDETFGRMRNFLPSTN